MFVSSSQYVHWGKVVCHPRDLVSLLSVIVTPSKKCTIKPCWQIRQKERSLGRKIRICMRRDYILFVRGSLWLCLLRSSVSLCSTTSWSITCLVLKHTPQLSVIATKVSVKVERLSNRWDQQWGVSTACPGETRPRAPWPVFTNNTYKF